MTNESADERWRIAGRWQEYEGESRANLLRVCGVALFYLIELFNRRHVTPEFHAQVTVLAAAWTAAACVIHLSLRRRYFPTAMKYLSTGTDVFLLTLLLLRADGPRSPLIAAYFFVLCLAALRFSLPLLRFTAPAAMLSYAVVARQAAARRPELAVAPHAEMIVLLALALCGTALGQILRRVREFADDYARGLESER